MAVNIIMYGGSLDLCTDRYFIDDVELYVQK